VALLRGLGGLGWLPAVVEDTVEALVALGELERAEEANGLLASRTGPRERAIYARGAALVAAARGDSAAARAAIESAAGVPTQEPFARGRTLLVQGSIERRAKGRGTARAALTAAFELFEELGAPLWAEKAAAELARIPGRRPAEGQLSETDRRVAELAAAGKANKEIAAALFVSVRAVEASLSRIYAQLGVRSRAELAARLARE
jgi:DNA-binding CsgD family transcriptional regulator